MCCFSFDRWQAAARAPPSSPRSISPSPNEFATLTSFLKAPLPRQSPRPHQLRNRSRQSAIHRQQAQLHRLSAEVAEGRGGLLSTPSAPPVVGDEEACLLGGRNITTTTKQIAALIELCLAPMHRKHPRESTFRHSWHPCKGCSSLTYDPSLNSTPIEIWILMRISCPTNWEAACTMKKAFHAATAKNPLKEMAMSHHRPLLLIPRTHLGSPQCPCSPRHSVQSLRPRSRNLLEGFRFRLQCQCQCLDRIRRHSGYQSHRLLDRRLLKCAFLLPSLPETLQRLRWS